MLIMFFNKTTTFLIHLENNQDIFVTCLFHYNRVYKSGWPWIIRGPQESPEIFDSQWQRQGIKKNYLQKQFPYCQRFFFICTQCNYIGSWFTSCCLTINSPSPSPLVIGLPLRYLIWTPFWRFPVRDNEMEHY